MILILCRCFEIEPYSHITYDYYMQMAGAVKYDVDLYVEKISRPCQHIEPQNMNFNPVRAYNVDFDPTVVHAKYAGQHSPNRPSFQGQQGPPLQPTGYRYFLFLTQPVFDHIKTHLAELQNRLRAIRVEVASALILICGTLPAAIVKMLNGLKTSSPHLDDTPTIPKPPEPHISAASLTRQRYPTRNYCFELLCIG
jgi:hypothetical protein